MVHGVEWEFMLLSLPTEFRAKKNIKKASCMNKNEKDYFADVIGGVKSTSARRLYDIIAKTCIDYRPSNSFFFTIIGKKLSSLDDGEQVDVVNKVISRILSSAKNQVPTTVREVTFCVEAEVEKYLNHKQSVMDEAGLGSLILLEYEEDSDGNMGIAKTIPKMLDSDGNMSISKLHKNERSSRTHSLLSREYFTGVVCDDHKVSRMLLRILWEFVSNQLSSHSKHTPYTWGHLYHTLYGLDLAVYQEKDKDKAKALHSIFKKVTLNTIHCSIKNKRFPEGKFTEWDHSSQDYIICKHMSEWFADVIELIERGKNGLNCG